MPDPGNSGKIGVFDLFVILVVLLLLFGLYLYTGGDLSGLTRPGAFSGSENPLDQMIGSLQAVGDGLQNMFKGMLR